MTRDFARRLLRRTLTLHKPLVRLSRQRARAREQQGFRDEAYAVDREIARLGEGKSSIIVGPWLAEVGYEVLYWVPFLRWFADKYAIPRERLIVVSRGGVSDWYAELAAHYVDLFDIVSPHDLAEKNRSRQASSERGGQKQTSISELDRELIEAAQRHLGVETGSICHPSLLFRLFRHVWYGNLPMDFLWTRTRFVTRRPPAPLDAQLDAQLPERFAVVKFYSGTALPMTDQNESIVRGLVRRLARTLPVISLESDFGIDEHRDFTFADIDNVTSTRSWMTPSNNLGIQSRLIARADSFAGTCGGLTWLAPFFGVPTTAVFADDQLLGSHLMIARHAGRAAGAAEFSTMDLRAIDRLGLRCGITD